MSARVFFDWKGLSVVASVVVYKDGSGHVDEFESLEILCPEAPGGRVELPSEIVDLLLHENKTRESLEEAAVEAAR